MLFSLYDVKSESFGTLFNAKTSGDATRIVVETIRSGKDLLLSRYTDDFQLFLIGNFDDITGEISSAGKKFIASGTELKSLAFDCMQQNDVKEDEGCEIA